MNPDGSGIGTPKKGALSPGHFVITKSRIVGGVKLAEELYLIAEQLEPDTGNLVTGVTTRQVGFPH